MIDQKFIHKDRETTPSAGCQWWKKSKNLIYKEYDHSGENTPVKVMLSKLSISEQVLAVHCTQVSKVVLIVKNVPHQC